MCIIGCLHKLTEKMRNDRSETVSLQNGNKTGQTRIEMYGT